MARFLLTQPCWPTFKFLGIPYLIEKIAGWPLVGNEGMKPYMLMMKLKLPETSLRVGPAR